ncbi:SET domain-containing protein-lysine N-methyltransferase [Aquicella lusitana]|uniref:SET domain-containing protein n=1 Tax=Aquicella lusitana TaxID=254246 RepID=A0A370GJH3_9COXI|nr:SET domain-containing protein-lysine N-methyltransferase [Aquicella lusitana]RDI42083.1 hypothetical protein C8D86_11637 [Aquicella lusitana]VVC74410.1 hypothetical protein AQULUS_21760 [Aquicella lusitana]
MKKKLIQNKSLIVKKSPTHGYGVFAGKKIKKNEIIEECYTIISKGGDKVLEDYYFDARGKSAIPTGFGIIYNHADEPNTGWSINVKTRIMTIKAIRTIQPGEEIFVSYGDEWFSSRGIKAKTHKKKRK